MQTEEVKYSMTLSDLVSGKLEQADQKAKKFEHSMSGVRGALDKLGERAIKIGETLGISFAYVKLEEFFHEGTEMAHHFDVAVGQLENTLKNVGERAGLSAQEMVKMATDAAKVMPFTKEQFVEMETALSRFGNMTPKVFQQVLALSADMAVALKRDGRETAMALGRIMEAPAENGRLLRQFGITLDSQQRKLLNTMEHTGHVAQAQTYLFQLLASKGFAGAARAAADSDPLFRYNKIMERLKYSVGGVGVTMLETLAPALEKVAGAVESSIEWFRRHEEIAKVLAVTVGALGASYVTFAIYEKAVAVAEWATVSAKKALAFVTGQEIAQSVSATESNIAEAESANALAGAYGRAATAKRFSVSGFMGGGGGLAAEGAEVGETVAAGASMFSGIGEILAVVAGVGTLFYGLSKAMSGDDPKTKEAREGQIEGMEKTSSSLDGLGSSADTASDSVQTFAEKTSQAIHTIDDKIKQAKGELSHMSESSKIPETKEQKFQKTITMINQQIEKVREDRLMQQKQFAEDLAFVDKYGFAAFEERKKKGLESTLSKLQGQRDKLMGKLNPTHDIGEVSKVTGNHPVNIHIKIDALIKGFSITTQNMTDSAIRIKEEVTKVLLSAVNDSQIVAGI